MFSRLWLVWDDLGNSSTGQVYPVAHIKHFRGRMAQNKKRGITPQEIGPFWGVLPCQSYLAFVTFKHLIFPLNYHYWENFALVSLRLHILIQNFA